MNPTTLLRRPTFVFLVFFVTLSPCHLVTLSHAREAPFVRWPEKPGSGGEQFEGGHFLPLTPAPLVGNGPFSVSVWVSATDLAGGNKDYGRGIARSTRNDQVGDWLL